MNQANGLLGNMGSVMKTAVIGAAAAGGAALVGLGAKSASVAADFEAQMNILSVAAGDSEVSLESLREAALLVGSDTQLVGIDAAQAADAMTNFYKAGLNTTDIFADLNAYLETGTDLSGAMRAAVDLQAASELDLAQASSAIAVAMATFGLSAEDATRITDSFVQTADASVADVSDLVAAMANVGPTAAAFGWSLEDVNTALGILSMRGISGAEAGTALKSMMTNIMSDTTATTDALSELGIELYDVDGTMRSLPDIIGQLSGALEVGATSTYQMSAASEETRKQVQTLRGQLADANREMEAYQTGALGANLTDTQRAQKINALTNAIERYQWELAPLERAIEQTTTVTRTMTEEQRNQHVQTLAGTYGMKAMNTLLTEGTEGWENMRAQIAEAASAQDVASIRTQGFQGAMEQLQGAIQTFMINVGTPLLENFLTPGVKLLTDWIGELSSVGLSAESVSAAFETVRASLETFIATISDIVTADDPLAALWTLISTKALEAWPTIQTTVETAIGGMISGATTWVTTNAPVYGALLWNALKGWVDTAVTFVSDNAGTWGDTIGAWLGTAVSGAVTWLTTNVPVYAASLWTTVKAWVDGAIASLGAEGATIGNDIGAKLGTTVSAAITWLAANVPTYAADLWGHISTMLTDALTFFSDNSGTWGTSYGEMVGTVIRTAIGGIALLAGELWTAIQGLFTSATGEGEGGESKASMLASGLINLFTGFWNGFITGITGNPQWYTDLTAWIDTTILQPFRDIDLLAPMKTALQGIIDGTTEKAEEISTAITDIVGRIVNPFKEIDLAQIGRDIINGLKNGIADAAGGVTDAVGGAARSAVDWAKDTLGIGSPSTVFADIGADLMRGLELGIERNTYRPREAIGQASSTVSNTFNLQATYGGQMPSNLEGLLTQLLQGMRGRGYSVPLPDMGG